MPVIAMFFWKATREGAGIKGIGLAHLLSDDTMSRSKMTPTKHPNVIILAGPNGSGKSTTAPMLLKGALGVKEFVNADVIARGLSAFDPERAALFLVRPWPALGADHGLLASRSCTREMTTKMAK